MLRDLVDLHCSSETMKVVLGINQIDGFPNVKALNLTGVLILTVRGHIHDK